MFFDTFGDIISIYVKALESLFKTVRVRFRGVRFGPVEFELKHRATSTYESTLEKIGQTKTQLEEAISAVDSLHSEITTKKIELDNVIASIQANEEQRQTIEQEKELSERLLQEDADKLREVIGVYQLRQSRTDKIVGFLGGVFASLVAAGIWTLIAHFM